MKKFNSDVIRKATINDLQKSHGIDLTDFKLHDKRQALRNCVSPEVGAYCLDCFINAKDKNGNVVNNEQ